MIRRIVRSLLSERTRARLRYHLHPESLDTWGGPFNGQCGRQQIFLDMVNVFPFTCIVETGTFLGETTAFLARESKLPVLTVESGSYALELARLRMRPYPSVRLFCGDSREFLRNLPSLMPADSTRPCFYLDAHWDADLPLLEEVGIILADYPRAVILIDDFEVPGDPGYGFDDCGDGNVLSLRYLAGAIEEFQPSVAFPALPSDRESGSKRGCVVLASAAWKETLCAVPTLKRI